MMFRRLILSRSELLLQQAVGVTLLVLNVLFVAAGLYELSDHLASFLASVLHPGR